MIFLFLQSVKKHKIPWECDKNKALL